MGRRITSETNLSRWLEARRGEVNIKETLQMQAKNLGFAVSELSKFASGKRQLSSKNLKKIVKYYNLTPQETKELFIAALTPECLEVAKKIKSDNSISDEDIGLYIQYGLTP